MLDLGLFARCLYCLNAAGSGWVVLPWVIGLQFACDWCGVHLLLAVWCVGLLQVLLCVGLLALLCVIIMIMPYGLLCVHLFCLTFGFALPVNVVTCWFCAFG